jgi:hypothetical protein
MSRSTGRLVAVAALVAVLGAGCASQDVDGADATSVLEDAGAPEEVSTCVGERIDDELTQGQKNEVGKADRLSDLDDELEQEVQGILDECVAGEGSGDEGDEGGSEGSDTSETTESDADATTTSAPG